MYSCFYARMVPKKANLNVHCTDPTIFTTPGRKVFQEKGMQYCIGMYALNNTFLRARSRNWFQTEIYIRSL